MENLTQTAYWQESATGRGARESAVEAASGQVVVAETGVVTLTRELGAVIAAQSAEMVAV